MAGTPPVPPPPAPAAAVNPADPLNVVLSGMSQLQVLVSELSKKKGDGTSPEAVKGVSSLPSLPEPGHEDSTLGFSEWIHGVKPAMSDLSGHFGPVVEPGLAGILGVVSSLPSAYSCGAPGI